MAKRFTDSEKWKRPWFRKLSVEAKLTWFYLLDQCDHCGVWYADFELLSLQVGVEVTEEKIKGWFGSKLTQVDNDKYHIPSFIEFQYGVLNENNRAHKKVLEFLKKKEGASKPLNSPLEGAKDKDKDKVSLFNTKTNKEETGIKTKLELTQENLAALGKTYDSQFLEEGIAAFNVELAGRDPNNAFTQNVERLPPIVQFNRFMESRAKRLKYKRDQKTKKGIICT